jgi:hypothetical protein
MMIHLIIYGLCAATSTGCALLLLRGYRASRARLLFWAALCFVGLALNNILVFVDEIMLPLSIDLSLWRALPALVGVAAFIYGLIWELHA